MKRRKGNREGLRGGRAPSASAVRWLCFTVLTLLDASVPSLRRGHANILCVVPILTDDPRRESSASLCLLGLCRLFPPRSSGGRLPLVADLRGVANIYIYIYIYTYIHIHIYIYIYTHTHIHLSLSLPLSLSLYIYIYTHILYHNTM